jgi:type III restriction enzyme
MEYKFDNESKFKKLLTEFFRSLNNSFIDGVIRERIERIEFFNDIAIAKESQEVYTTKKKSISTMKYSSFLKELSKQLNVNITSLHESIIDSGTELNDYLNQTTIRSIKQNFEYYLMAHAFNKFSIEYKKVSNYIHPTKLTDDNGKVFDEYSPNSDIGRIYDEYEKVADNYFFGDLFYDSELEKSNIISNINEVVVFTKIPKNSIKIPVAGGKSYSPDFAYVLKFKNGEQKLHFIVETKDVNNDEGLRDEEKYKIKHAEKFFDGKVKIEFKTQFRNNRIVDLINNIYNY